jgi:hypothetical protein
MTMTFDLDDAAVRIAADPLDRVLFNLLGRESARDHGAARQPPSPVRLDAQVGDDTISTRSA